MKPWLIIAALALAAGAGRKARSLFPQIFGPEHAADLAVDGGPRSMVTGARLIMLTDKGCGQ